MDPNQPQPSTTAANPKRTQSELEDSPRNMGEITSKRIRKEGHCGKLPRSTPKSKIIPPGTLLPLQQNFVNLQHRGSSNAVAWFGGPLSLIVNERIIAPNIHEDHNTRLREQAH